LERDLTDFNKWRGDKRDQAEEACSFKSSEKIDREPKLFFNYVFNDDLNTK